MEGIQLPSKYEKPEWCIEFLEIGMQCEMGHETFKNIENSSESEGDENMDESFVLNSDTESDEGEDELESDLMIEGNEGMTNIIWECLLHLFAFCRSCGKCVVSIKSFCRSL